MSAYAIEMMQSRIEEGQDRDPIAAQPTRSGAGFESLLGSLRPYFAPLTLTGPNSCLPFKWRSDVVSGCSVSVVRARYSSGWSYTYEAGNRGLNLAFLTEGAANMTVGASSVTRTPAVAGLYSVPALKRHEVCTVNGRYAGCTIRFEHDVVSKSLGAVFGCPVPGNLELAPLVDLTTGIGQSVYFLARALVLGLHGDQRLLRSPLSLALLLEASLRLIFENVPHRLTARLNRKHPEGTSNHIRRAIDYMRANLHLPVSIADIAIAVGVSDRSLQLGFRKYRDMSPAVYLRRIRLEAVHAELSLAENELPVREVALKWGFSHMGRFASQYREMFGTYPSSTAIAARLNHGDPHATKQCGPGE